MSYNEMHRQHRERFERIQAEIEADAERMATYTPPATDNTPAWLAELAACRERIAELEARPTITWIPVSERLPDAGLRVLAAYNDGRMTTTLRALYIPASIVTCSEYNVDMVEIADYDEATGNYYYPAGWYECVESADDYSYIGPLTGTVTHWALPPALPKVEVKP